MKTEILITLSHGDGFVSAKTARRMETTMIALDILKKSHKHLRRIEER
jgi:hypothetical protein